MPPLEGRRLPMEVEEWLRELVRSLREVEPDVEVYLTGSYARGDWPDDSDVDLIVVSRIFENLDLGERYKVVKRHARPGYSLDLTPLTPQEFRRRKENSVILQDMLEHAVKIA
ncbi:MAG: nucleotidyltransferase domain-containing protein [Candidatus Jordarchaeales archaeon]